MYFYNGVRRLLDTRTRATERERMGTIDRGGLLVCGVTLRERRVATRAVCGRRRWPRRGYSRGRDVMMIDYVTFARGGGEGINVFTTWIRGNRCGDGHYIIIINIKGLAKILWLQTNASLARARAFGFWADHSTRDPIISRCVCVLVSCGYMRTIIILYIIMTALPGENAVIPSPHNAACVFVPFVLRFSLIILSNVDRAKYIIR